MARNVFAGTEPLPVRPLDAAARADNANDNGQALYDKELGGVQGAHGTRLRRVTRAGADGSRRRRGLRPGRAAAAVAAAAAAAAGFAAGHSSGDSAPGGPAVGDQRATVASELGSRERELDALEHRVASERRRSDQLRAELRREARQRYAWQQWARVFGGDRYERLITAAQRRRGERTSRQAATRQESDTRPAGR